MDITPADVAELIVAGAEAVGAKVTYNNASTTSRFGLVIVEYPTGATFSIKIEEGN